MGPLKGIPGISGSFCLTQMARIPTSFYSQILCAFFLGLEPWIGEPLFGARAPHSFRESSAAMRSLPVLSHHGRVRDHLSLRLYPSYQTRCAFLFISSDVCITIS